MNMLKLIVSFCALFSAQQSFAQTATPAPAPQTSPSATSPVTIPLPPQPEAKKSPRIDDPFPAPMRTARNKERMLAGAERRFQAIDTNNDGVIDASEREAMIAIVLKRVRDRIEKRFNDADANKDGKLTKQEFADNVSALFKAMDSDGDGNISVQERRDYMRNMRRQNREAQPKQ